MSFEKLNKKANEFFVSKTPENFNNVYQEVIEEFQRQNRRRVTSTGLGSIDDADEILDSVILKLTARDGALNFGKLVSRSLKNARIDFLRSELRRSESFELSIDSSEESALTLNIADSELVEDRVLKKEDDQRQLIAYLSDPTQVDDVTTLIVTKFSQYDSITALAKALGIHHETVSRKLRKLSRRYDANRFGEIGEYLAV
ncbi:hypothetical protein ABH892_004440 [Paenibacillus sp. RC254]|uniref:hypothetical protein n=1 Tax=unclassified Paenibacillus TaxID=185978 RepID=UPI0024B919C7|nr:MULTISPECIES: hypothetical protein [unclassified Paenibacillus]